MKLWIYKLLKIYSKSIFLFKKNVTRFLKKKDLKIWDPACENRQKNQRILNCWEPPSLRTGKFPLEKNNDTRDGSHKPPILKIK